MFLAPLPQNSRLHRVDPSYGRDGYCVDHHQLLCSQHPSTARDCASMSMQKQTPVDAPFFETKNCTDAIMLKIRQPGWLLLRCTFKGTVCRSKCMSSLKQQWNAAAKLSFLKTLARTKAAQLQAWSPARVASAASTAKCIIHWPRLMRGWQFALPS